MSDSPPLLWSPVLNFGFSPPLCAALLHCLPHRQGVNAAADYGWGNWGGEGMADTFEKAQGVPAVAAGGRELLQLESGSVCPRGVGPRWWVPWQCQGAGAAGQV